MGLAATGASDADYVSPLSLRGAFIFITPGIVLRWFLYKLGSAKPHET